MEEKIVKKITTFLKKYPLVKYKKGQIIYKPEDSSKVYFIKSGYTRVFLISNQDKEITLPMIKSLFFSSLVSHITERQNNYYFQAISEVEAWVVPQKEIVEFIENDPKIYREIIKDVIEEFVVLTEKFQQLILSDAYVKVASLICSMADVNGNKTNKDVKIEFNIPHRILASMTGLTRETVTLQILKMQKDGLVKIKGRTIIIKDYKRFKKLTDF